MAETIPAPAAEPARAGRRRSTSRAALERIALELFDRDGFEHTTVDDIAAAAGIGRRTFFRYYASKNDAVWGEFDLEALRARLELHGPQTPMMDAIRAAVLEFNRVEGEEALRHRRRMELILRVPPLRAHSPLRAAEWRSAVEGFAARRTGEPAGSLLPRTIASAVLGACIAGYEQWLADEGADLQELLDRALRELAAGFGRLG